jgi:hypothetical protein
VTKKNARKVEALRAGASAPDAAATEDDMGTALARDRE